jgi:hypothetical protein
MHVHVRVKQHLATVQRRGSFRCAVCKHWQRAEVRGMGAGTVTLLSGEDGARERAQLNAAKNGDRLLRFARCPKCRQRSGLGAFAGRYVLVFLICAPMMFLLGLLWPAFDHSLDAGEIHIFRTWVPLFTDVFVALMIFGAAVSEWRSIPRRVRWLDF